MLVSLGVNMLLALSLCADVSVSERNMSHTHGNNVSVCKFIIDMKTGGFGPVCITWGSDPVTFKQGMFACVCKFTSIWCCVCKRAAAIFAV